MYNNHYLSVQSTKKRKSRPMRCCLSFFALVTCAALAVGFLGNHVLHNGIEGFEHSLKNINDVIRRAQQGRTTDTTSELSSDLR